MGVTETQTYRVILNNKMSSYRPNRATLDSLVRYLPDCKILGFGYYSHYQLWYLLVYSPTFPLNPFAGTSNLDWFAATGTSPFTTTKGWEPVKI